jgi:hypothetical protein
VTDGRRDPDVTPVGRPRQQAGSPPAPLDAPSHDPFGAQTWRRRRHPLLVVAGAALLVAGIVWGGLGVVETVRSASGIEESAVAKGVVGEGSPARLELGAPGAGDYTAYLRTDGLLESEENRRDATVASLECAAGGPGGDGQVMRGSRQGSTLVVGDSATIGTFTAAEGQVTLTCAYVDRSLRSERLRDDDAEVFVTPGRPAESMAVLAVVGGSFAALGGVLLLVRGLRHR